MRYAHICVLLFLLASVGSASADYLNINTGQECGPGSCDLQIYINGPGSPAAGYGIFEVINLAGNRWSFTFQTPDPYRWGFDMYGYYAEFGPGGTFQMTGPRGLTFLGEITNGGLANNSEAYIATLNFTGQWSNSLDASGQFTIYDGGYRVEYLDVATGLKADRSAAPTEVPEPASLALLFSGTAAAGAVRRRMRI